eukprot:Rhum_TRINITY_DN14715_c3_g1::Rhum_TRINITY_DN14715_c3_g1_i1::g.111178::m.111178
MKLPVHPLAVSRVLSYLSNRTLILVRHGQAGHNVFLDAARETSGEERDELRARGYSLRDPLLTPAGREQSARLRGAWDGRSVDLLVASPMRRALETAELGFPDVKRKVVHPVLREREGGIARLCDMWLSVEDSAAALARPGDWDWDHARDGCLPPHHAPQGTLVTPDDVRRGIVDLAREPPESVAARAVELLTFLASFPTPDDATIALVGHGDFWTVFSAMFFSKAQRLGNCGYMVCNRHGILHVSHGAGECDGASSSLTELDYADEAEEDAAEASPTPSILAAHM